MNNKQKLFLAIFTLFAFTISMIGALADTWTVLPVNNSKTNNASFGYTVTYTNTSYNYNSSGDYLNKWNFTNITMWTNAWDAWGVNGSADTVGSMEGVAQTFHSNFNASLGLPQTILSHFRIYNMSGILMATSNNYTLTYDLAEFGVSIPSPTNATKYSTSAITINYTATGDASLYTCSLFNDFNGTLHNDETTSNVANNTVYQFIKTLSVGDGEYQMFINCTSIGDYSTYNVSATTRVMLSSDLPVINVSNIVASGSYLNTANISTKINVSVTTRYPSQCRLISNIDKNRKNATNSSYWDVMQTKAYSNLTSFIFTQNNLGLLSNTNATNGPYIFQIICNNTANLVSGTANFSYYVDTVAPVLTGGIFNLSYPLNYSIWSDPTPRFNWSIVNDNQCFANYTVYYSNNSAFTTANTHTCVATANTTNYCTPSNNILNTEQDWYWYVNVSDCAGNTNSSGEGNAGIDERRTYTVDLSGCYNLSTGWQACAIVETAGSEKNLSKIASETGATTVSYYNITHQWVSYSTAATTVNNGVKPKVGEAVFLYIPTVTYWEDINYGYTGVHGATRSQRFLGNGTTLVLKTVVNESMGTIAINTTFNVSLSQLAHAASQGPRVLAIIDIYNSTGADGVHVGQGNWSFDAVTQKLSLLDGDSFNMSSGFYLTYNYTGTTGASVNNWNLVGITNRSSTTLLALSNVTGWLANTPEINFTSMVFYNNSAVSTNRHVPYIVNWTINNATPIRAGNAVWVEINGSKWYNITL